jgi:hypothetical protein
MRYLQRLTAVLRAAIFLSAGCAATRDRPKEWPSLPSPWSTVKQTPAKQTQAKQMQDRLATATNAAKAD